MTEIMNDNIVDTANRMADLVVMPLVHNGEQFIHMARVLDLVHAGDGGPINHGDPEGRTYIKPSWATEPVRDVRHELWVESQAVRNYSFKEYHHHTTTDEFWSDVQEVCIKRCAPCTVATLASVSEAYRMGLAAGGVEVYGPWHWKQQLAWASENPYKVGDRRRTIYNLAVRAAEWIK